MMHTMAGAAPDGIGWEHIRIAPHTMNQDVLQGKVTTPQRIFHEEDSQF